MNWRKYTDQNHFLGKIKLNKQPSILDKSYARNFSPYSELTDNEIDLKCETSERISDKS